MTKIEWTERTWNPIVGCSIVSPGCTNCYAMKMAGRIEAIDRAAREAKTTRPLQTYPLSHYTGTTQRANSGHVWTGKVAMAPDHILAEPLRRKKPTLYFVNSMGDLFHEDVPDEWIDRVFAIMALTPQHTYQVLTKRAARMRRYFDDAGEVSRQYFVAAEAARMVEDGDTTLDVIGTGPWPLPNVWLGVSAERQQEADARIPDLLATPASVRFASAEPLLRPIDFTRIALVDPGRSKYALNGITLNALSGYDDWHGAFTSTVALPATERIDWIIVGGESGPNARPMHPDWARSIRDQCRASDVAFFFKQWGEWAPEVLQAEKGGVLSPYDGGELKRFGKRIAGRHLDGRTWDQMPGSFDGASDAHAASAPDIQRADDAPRAHVGEAVGGSRAQRSEPREREVKT